MGSVRQAATAPTGFGHCWGFSVLEVGGREAGGGGTGEGEGRGSVVPRVGQPGEEGGVQLSGSYARSNPTSPG